MGARKIGYAEYEGGELKPWRLKPWGFDPPFVLWADGKLYDGVLEITRHRFNRKRVKEKEALMQGIRDD
jgi:hypothetical protein